MKGKVTPIMEDGDLPLEYLLINIEAHLCCSLTVEAEWYPIFVRENYNFIGKKKTI